MDARQFKSVSIDELNSLRQRLHAAILIRSLKDAGEFATNLTFLKEVDNIYNDYYRLVDQQSNEQNSTPNSTGSFVIFKRKPFSPASAKVGVKEVREKLFTPVLKDVFEKELAKDPRIIDLNIDRDIQVKSVIDQNGVEQQVVSNIVNCRITYCDNTVLAFHTLTDQTTLAIVENTFSAKMLMLSQAMSKNNFRL